MRFPLKKRHVSWLAALAGFLSLYGYTRLLWLDQDLNERLPRVLQPIDEFYYSILAFDVYHAGGFPQRSIDFVPTDSNMFHFMGNVFTYVSLQLFGNNYYGLRGGAVICGGIVAVFLLDRLWRTSRQLGGSSLYRCGLMLALAAFLLFDVSFLINSRFLRPMGFRMLGTCGIIYVFARMPKTLNPRSAAVLGVAAIVLSLFIYPTNVFIPVATLAALVMYSTPRRRLKNTLVFLVAVVGMLGLYKGLDSWLMDGSPFSYYFSAASNRIATAGMTTKYASLLHTNTLRTSPAIVILLALLFPMFALNAYRTKNRSNKFIVLLFLAQICQVAFIADYPIKKHTTFFPFICIFLFEGAACLEREWEKFMDWLRSLERLVPVALCLFLATMAAMECKSRLPLTHQPKLGDYELSSLIMTATIAVLAGVLLTYRIRPTLRSTGRRGAMLLLLVVFPIASYINAYEGLFEEPRFTYRNFMIRAARWLDDEPLVAGWSYAARLYNRSKPACNSYRYDMPEARTEMGEYTHRSVREGKVKYHVGYKTRTVGGRRLKVLLSTRPMIKETLYLYQLLPKAKPSRRKRGRRRPRRKPKPKL
ncbi:hypothetical protein JYT28_01020 [Desulfobulbus sp. AH-315-M07]|nr:hypothetical protein [Desulfobulbus sp. AH-315-M07]